MGLRDPLPRPVAWIARIIGWSVGGVAIAIAWYVAGNMRLVTHFTDCLENPGKRGALKPTAMESAKALVACVDARSGFVEALAFRPTKRLFAALPSAPCYYVGTWSSVREDSIYQVTLSADGQFLAEPVKTSDRDARTVTGSWGVVGTGNNQNMVWLYDEGHVWPPDINPIKNPTAAAFTLIEKNGSRTELSRTGSANCSATEPPTRPVSGYRSWDSTSGHGSVA